MDRKPTWPLTLYFDGECPLCAREIKTLRGRAAPERLRFVDIRDEGFEPESMALTFAQMESLLHARFADGTWVTGLDATLWSWPRRLGCPFVMALGPAAVERRLPAFLPLAATPGLAASPRWCRSL